MPRLNIIVLDQTPEDANTYNFVLWADVPAARQTYYANPNAKSAWSGATTTDNTNLQTGLVAERVFAQRVQAGTTLAQIEAFMQTQWQNYQSYVNSYNPWIHYGSTWDGNTWTVLTGA
jgi:hypothetical protein